MVVDHKSFKTMNLQTTLWARQNLLVAGQTKNGLVQNVLVHFIGTT